MPVIKIIELIGQSTNNWQEAVENALKEASKTLRNIKSIDVVGCSVKVENNKIVEYRSNVKVAFIVERL